jgi:HAE1 family hydrophobic/amphiphilic exporter-1
MNIAQFSIKRPIFISCLVILMMITGVIGLNRMGVDLFPPIDFPVVTVTTIYPGATPEEIEKLISKPLEEQVSTISGIKRLSSRNLEGISIVIAEFTYETDVKYAEQKMREKVALARNNLPDDLEDEPLVRQFDFTNMPVLTLAVMAELPPAEMYDLVKEKIKPLIEQADGVGEVMISGGTRREIRIELDRAKLNAYEIPAFTVAENIRNSGANVPIGKFDRGGQSTIFKTVGEFNAIEQIRKSVVNFAGDVANAVTVDRIGTVRDGTEDIETLTYLYYPVKDEKKRSFFGKKDGKKVEKETRPCIILDVYKQSGANSVAVADRVVKRIDRVNEVIKTHSGNPRLVFVYDTAKWIRSNIADVQETMIIGIILAVIVVYFFLGNVRSTIITGIAIPNSILGAFVIMYFMGFTINLMTLMALSLSVGLLVDDAIVVRENIFRKLESGMSAFKAAAVGTTEVMLAVLATTLTIIAVFLPIGFLQGIVGRFFHQFGLAVVFAMCISLFDALAVAPLLSAYFAGTGAKAKNRLVVWFDRLQDRTDALYAKVLTFSVNRPVTIIGVTSLVFFLSIGAFAVIGKTFSPDADENEVMINFEMPSGTSIQGTMEVAQKIAERMKSIPELDYMTIKAGNDQGEYNLGVVGVFFVTQSEGRKRHSVEIKKDIRKLLEDFAFVQPSVDEYNATGGGTDKPFILNLTGEDLDVLQNYSVAVVERLRTFKDLAEVSTSYKKGKPEFQVVLDNQRMQTLGVNHKMAGMELRYHVEGGVVGKFREKGLEYDVRMRLKPEQRDLKQTFYETRVPNVQMKMIPLSAIATGRDAVGPAKILRQDRARVIQVMANIAAGGAVGTAIEETRNLLEKELPMPDGVGYSFVGQADAFEDMVSNILFAFMLSLLFIYLVLASLYESFITPVTIFMALPPALSGAFISLFITGLNMDMFSMIGIIMLLGLVTKNSILLVDFALEGVRSGLERKEAIRRAGMVRLRPILMTTFAMLAGTLPLALGIGEAAQYRQSMGVVIIGGLIISTLITLIVVPAVFEYVDRFREAIEGTFRPKPEMAGTVEDAFGNGVQFAPAVELPPVARMKEKIKERIKKRK